MIGPSQPHGLRFVAGILRLFRLNIKVDREAVRGHLAMLLFAALISISFSLGSYAAPHIDPAALTAVRFIIATLIVGVAILPIAKLRHFKSPWRFMVVGGMLAGYFVLMFEALKHTDPVSTAAVFTLTPFMSAVFAYLLLRQVSTLIMIGAILLAALGAIWVIFRADLDAILGLRFGYGEKLFLIGCAMHALYTPLGRLLNRGEPLLVYTWASICGGLLVTGIYGAEAISQTNWFALPGIVWITMLYLGVFTTACTVYLIQFATLRLPSAKVMAYGFLVPVFVILWEGLIGHGWVALTVVPGVLAIVLGLLLLLFDSSDKKKEG